MSTVAAVLSHQREDRIDIILWVNQPVKSEPAEKGRGESKHHQGYPICRLIAVNAARRLTVHRIHRGVEPWKGETSISNLFP